MLTSHDSRLTNTSQTNVSTAEKYDLEDNSHAFSPHSAVRDPAENNPSPMSLDSNRAIPHVCLFLSGARAHRITYVCPHHSFCQSGICCSPLRHSGPDNAEREEGIRTLFSAVPGIYRQRDPEQRLLHNSVHDSARREQCTRQLSWIHTRSACSTPSDRRSPVASERSRN